MRSVVNEDTLWSLWWKKDACAPEFFPFRILAALSPWWAWDDFFTSASELLNLKFPGSLLKSSNVKTVQIPCIDGETEIEGKEYGNTEGEIVETIEGEIVGTIEGEIVGTAEREIVRTIEGKIVRTIEGVVVGNEDGLKDGDKEGVWEGEDDGREVGINEGNPDEDDVGTWLVSAIGVWDGASEAWDDGRFFPANSTSSIKTFSFFSFASPLNRILALSLNVYSFACIKTVAL